MLQSYFVRGIFYNNRSRWPSKTQGGIILSFMNNLIEQAKHPKGKLGAMMLRMMNSAHTKMYQWALDLIESDGVPTILDVGCGGGKSINLLAVKFPNSKIYGIDHSEQAVQEAIKANQQGVSEGNITILQADVMSLPFEENTFQIVTAFQNHYFWPDLEQSVKEVFRVLNTGGSFWIVCEVASIEYHMKSYRTNDEMERLLKLCDFRDVNFYEHNRWIGIQGIK